jgi:hypothetical protein
VHHVFFLVQVLAVLVPTVGIAISDLRFLEEFGLVKLLVLLEMALVVLVMMPATLICQQKLVVDRDGRLNRFIR